jgi:hypothetical protein
MIIRAKTSLEPPRPGASPRFLGLEELPPLLVATAAGGEPLVADPLVEYVPDARGPLLWRHVDEVEQLHEALPRLLRDVQLAVRRGDGSPPGRAPRLSCPGDRDILMVLMQMVIWHAKANPSVTPCGARSAGDLWNSGMKRAPSPLSWAQAISLVCGPNPWAPCPTSALGAIPVVPVDSTNAGGHAAWAAYGRPDVHPTAWIAPDELGRCSESAS